MRLAHICSLSLGEFFPSVAAPVGSLVETLLSTLYRAAEMKGAFHSFPLPNGCGPPRMFVIKRMPAIKSIDNAQHYLFCGNIY